MRNIEVEIEVPEQVGVEIEVTANPEVIIEADSNVEVEIDLTNVQIITHYDLIYEEI